MLGTRVLVLECAFVESSCLLHLGYNHPDPFSSQTISEIP